MKNIFPKEFITGTIEFHRYHHLKKSQTIYMILILGLLITAILLPFVEIDLYSSSRGMIRPIKQRNIINSPINGKVKAINVHENTYVEQGDTLVVLDNHDIGQLISSLKIQVDSISLEIKDLEYLLKNELSISDSLESQLLKTQFQEHLFKNQSILDEIHFNSNAFKRQEKLFHLGVIARKEFEISQARSISYKNKLAHYKSQNKRKWQHQYQSKLAEIRTLNTKVLKLEKERNQHFIIAPVDGTVQDLIGIEKNNFVYTGASIAHISPQTDLLVECFVNPSDIGMIKKDLPVTFQIDAFDHNYWGTASGEIIQISEDNYLLNNTPMYKVLCSLNENKLFLENSIPGELKKGMTLNAQFFIKNRTALQLLFDDLNDWY
ncbi:HlyD family secretion protein [Lutimonas sp.]|uniref:HlyD family secretion protein n=1 Tax=Lutimonas sp. TaxID=1872403 RepID=UPI003D9ABA4E